MCILNADPFSCEEVNSPRFLQEDGTPRSKRQKTRHSENDEDADDVKQEDGEEEEDGEDGEEEQEDKTEADQTHETSLSDKKDKRKSKFKPASDAVRGHFNSPMKKPATVTPKKSGPIAVLYASMEDGADLSPGKGDRRRERRKGSRDDAVSSISETVI